MFNISIINIIILIYMFSLTNTYKEINNYSLSEKYSIIKKLLNESDYIIIGAGAGLSTAAGLDYSGPKFQKEFEPWIKKYNFKDLYTSGFYPFQTEEEKWAYWSKHIYYDDLGIDAADLYKKLFNLVKNHNYYIVTTNVDDQFYKAGFDPEKITRYQGSYSYLQCKRACHNKLYNYNEKFIEMVNNIDYNTLKIPSNLIPKCPVCGGKMEINLRMDQYFVQDEYWYKMVHNYEEFLKKIEENKKILLLEFGIGLMTPSIIRYPFDKIAYTNKNSYLIRFNLDNKESIYQLDERYIVIDEDINIAIEKIMK